ncbi:MAG: radical SAM protein [Candidatus Omnitrophota bacterium]|jgi:radical SAM superfamily enzyme YgiQ (UPF0313 family)|nr:radical SAM protein [Candidatus Omnitrophota bacterium]
MAKITLIDPLGSESGLFRHKHFFRDWSGAYTLGYVPFVPLDLLYAASYLVKFGYRAEVIEASIKHLEHRKVINLLKVDPPDFVFIPSNYFSLNDDRHLAWLIRESFPKVKIIFGGAPVTYNPSLVLADGLADFVALGEIELPLLGIIKGDNSRNIALNKGGGVIASGKRELINLDDLPIPARNLIDNQAYRYAFFNKRNPVTAMSISRGCPHGKCKFCNAALYTLGQMRYRNIASITEELNEIAFKYNIKEVFFRDQTFTASRELVYAFCEEIIRNNVDISWRANTRVDLVDEELLALMRKAGCYQLSFGFESSSQKALDTNEKGITIEQSKQAARWCRQSGIEVLGNFILGGLGDTPGTPGDLFKFVLELGVDYANFNNYIHLPGTAIYDEYRDNKLPVIPGSMAKKYATLLNLKFYFRPRIISRQLKKIRSFADLRFLFSMLINTVLPRL